jgi:hypothetical protein
MAEATAYCPTPVETGFPPWRGIPILRGCVAHKGLINHLAINEGLTRPSYECVAPPGLSGSRIKPGKTGCRSFGKCRYAWVHPPRIGHLAAVMAVFSP